MIKYSSDKKCRFYEKKHTYWVGRTKYKSVTTIIGEQFTKFKPKKIARFLASLPFAKKSKKGVRYWLNEWKQSATTGTLIHAELEKLINNPHDYETLKPVLHPRTIIAWEEFNKFLKTIKEPTVNPEVLIYNEEYKIAGQIDVMITDSDNNITLLDWKATKDITFNYKYNNEEEKYGVTTNTMTMENCNGNKYTLQLSTYAYMLEKKGYKIKDLYIAHINPKNNSLEIIKVNYLKHIVKGILNDRLLELPLGDLK